MHITHLLKRSTLYSISFSAIPNICMVKAAQHQSQQEHHIQKPNPEKKERGAPTYLLLLQVGRPAFPSHCHTSPAKNRANQQNRNSEQYVRSGAEKQHGKKTLTGEENEGRGSRGRPWNSMSRRAAAPPPHSPTLARVLLSSSSTAAEANRWGWAGARLVTWAAPEWATWPEGQLTDKMAHCKPAHYPVATESQWAMGLEAQMYSLTTGVHF